MLLRSALTTVALNEEIYEAVGGQFWVLSPDIFLVFCLFEALNFFGIVKVELQTSPQHLFVDVKFFEKRSAHVICLFSVLKKGE
jgi:hypothetical protein